MSQVRQVVDACPLVLLCKRQPITKILVLNHQLEVRLHGVLMLLTDTQQVLSQLVVADEHFLDDADTGDQPILIVRGSGLVLCTPDHGHG